MKKFPISLLCTVATVLLTILLYFTILGNTLLEAIHFLCLIAILIAEIITGLYFMFANGKPRRIAAALISACTIPAAAGLSSLYIVNFPQGYGTYLGWYLAGMLIANTLALVLILFGNKKSQELSAFQQAKGNMLELRKLVKLIAADPAAQPYVQQLNALEEELHYSNDTVVADEDAELRLLLLQLQANIANTDYDTSAQLAKLEAAVAKRKLITSRNT